MTDKPTPTTDLLKRCAEIHEWRSTGVLSGEALRDYAKRKWPDRHDTLQMAEHETVTEALALLAKRGQQAQAAEPVAVVVPCYTPSGKRVALCSAKQDLPIGTKLYAAPKPSPTAQAGGVQEDAARYRFLRDGEWRDTDLEPFIRLQLNTLWDAKIDAARKQGEKQ